MNKRIFEGVPELRPTVCDACGNADIAPYYLIQESPGVFSSDIDWLGKLDGHRVRITVEDLGEPDGSGT